MPSGLPLQDASSSAPPPHISLLPVRSLASARQSSGSAHPATSADPPVAGWPRGLTETTPVAFVRAPSTTSFCSAAPRSEPPLATGSSSAYVPAPSGADATAVAANPDSPHSVPRSAEIDSPPATAEYAAHPGDRSSACVPALLGSRQRPPPRARSSVPPVLARTSAHARWLPSPPAPSFPGPRDRGRTSPLPRDVTSVALRNLQFPYPHTQFAGSPGDNRIYNVHVGSFAPFYPSLFGWSAPPSLLGHGSPRCYAINYAHRESARSLNLLAGINQVLQINFVPPPGTLTRNFVPRNWRVTPYFDWRAGLGDINAKGPLGVPYAQGQDFTFTLNLGSGLRYNFNSRSAISVGLNWMHISNANLSEHKFDPSRPAPWGIINYGINVYGPMVGIDIQLRKHQRHSEQ